MLSTENVEEIKPNINKCNHTGITPNPQYPWRHFNRVYDARGFIGLHQEIEDFVKYMTPTVEEHRVRLVVVNRIKTLIHSLWPRAIVEAFGSFATGLYLSTSDIDLVVCGHWNNPPLYILEKALIQYNITKAEHIKVLDKAIVPIIKLIDQSCNIKIDISFNMKNAVKSVQMIKDFSHHYPVLSKLVIVIKQFLFQRNLNEVFNGGISSYSLILMIISFLQLRPKKDCKKSQENLGTLLIEFFELYGRKFDYERNTIRIKFRGSLITKDELNKGTVNGHKPTTLCIEDPLTPGNDVGSGSYGIVYAKMEFELAFLILKSTLSSTNSYDANVQSILGRIIAVSDNVIQYRNWVRENSVTIINSISLKQTNGNEVNTKTLLPDPKRFIERGNFETRSWRTHATSNLGVAGVDNKREFQHFHRRNLANLEKCFTVQHCQSPLIPNPPLVHGHFLLPPQAKFGINNKYTNPPHQNHINQRVFYSKNMTQPKIEQPRQENYFFHRPQLIPFYSFRTCDTVFKPVGFPKNNNKIHQYRLSVPSADFLVAAW